MTQMTDSEFARLEEQAEGFVRSLRIPGCPEILARISREVHAQTPDLRKVADLVRRDVAAAGGILKTVNSAAYGLRRSARSVQQAISYLGLERTALLLAGLLLRKAFGRSDHPAMIRFWQSSAQLADTAAFFARVLRAAQPDEAHTFGLFRDAGSAVLIGRFPHYADTMAAFDETEACIRTDHEKAHFGADHAVIGSVLARDWHLPEEMSDAILWHHAEFVLALDAPPIGIEAVRLIALGLLGDRVLDRYQGMPADSRSGAGFEHALRLFGLDEREFADLQVEALTLLAERDGRPMPTMRLRMLRS